MSTHSPPDILFYDGECGLCHGFVRFTLAHDKQGLFRFAPLQGETFTRSLTAQQRALAPNSVVLLTADGVVTVRSAAAIYVLRRLAAFYRLLAALLRLIPRPVRDRLYDLVAHRRKRWFAQPPALCPLVPEDLRARFLP